MCVSLTKQQGCAAHAQPAHTTLTTSTLTKNTNKNFIHNGISSSWHWRGNCRHWGGWPGLLMQRAYHQLWQGDGAGRGGPALKGADPGWGERGDSDCCRLGDWRDHPLPCWLPPSSHGQTCPCLTMVRWRRWSVFLTLIRAPVTWRNIRCTTIIGGTALQNHLLLTCG